MRCSILIGMLAEPMTTIKVPKHLRERVSRDAAREGLTAAGLLSRLIDEHERQQRFAAVRRAYETEDGNYVEETVAWDSLSGDGLEA